MFAALLTLHLACTLPATTLEGVPLDLATLEIHASPQWGVRDTLLGSFNVAGQAGQPWAGDVLVPDDRCWSVWAITRTWSAVASPESPFLLANPAAFVCPPWRTPCQ